MWHKEVYRLYTRERNVAQRGVPGSMPVLGMLHKEVSQALCPGVGNVAQRGVPGSMLRGENVAHCNGVRLWERGAGRVLGQ